ncbi:MAG TPA: hypothetical protein VFV08_05995, partial [Puia sp.]|nr:hypothetical protein [Puia sp.]
MPLNHGKLQKNRIYFIIAFVVLIFIAFFQCYNITKDLIWAAEPDFDRDISYVQSVLDGQFGKDPSYSGAYLWYNPLLFSIETIIVKITGLPIHLVVTRAGIYLNLLGPVFFVIMMVILFDYRVALAALLSYLFLSAGDIPGWAVATYSPWLYPVNFAQFLFYQSIIFCYFAFARERYIWFIILGTTIGACFLGHTAPAVLIILIM